MNMNALFSTVHRLALASREVPVLIRYSVTIVVVVFVVWLWLYWGGQDQRHPFLIFFLIIFACGAFLDRGNGFLATWLSAGLIDYYMIAPYHTLDIANPSDQIALILFVVIGMIIAAVVEALHVGLVELAVEHELARKAVSDREILLEELSHRTRNDLANVITLLNLQARTADAGAREALASAADRVQTIARVHRRLQIYNDRVVVDTKSYINELCNDLRLSRLASRPIALECHAESHSVSLEKAVPLGLIINESVTNATKHAFPDERPGIITVRFAREGSYYNLTVADNGIGTPQAPTGGGTGSRLMQMLAAQLGSKIAFEDRHPGSAVIVTIAVKTEK
jgi:two-component sensor histidine kinase